MDDLDPVIQNLMEDDLDILEVLSDSDSDLETDAQWQFMVEEAARAIRSASYVQGWCPVRLTIAN